MNEQNGGINSARMGQMPEGKLLLTLAVPIMLSMLVQALYNIVDSIYVAQVSEDCLTALSLVFPAQNIMIGLATGTGVGVSSLISRALGADDRERAVRVAGNALFLCLCCWAAMFIFGVFGAQWFVNTQIDDAAVRDYAGSYLRIVSMGSVFLYFEITFERFLQSSSLTKLSMWTQMAGALTNIVLDPFFIYGWCGLPAMGTAGAAVATVLGQAVGAGLGLFFHLKHNKEVPLGLKFIRPKGRLIGEIYEIGFPSIIMMCIGSLTNYIMNLLLVSFTKTAVAVYGAYFKLQSFFFLPVFGINNGLIPIIGYNYGAGKVDRIHRTIRYGVLFAAVFMLLGLALFELAPGLLLSAFNPSAEMLDIGTHAMRRIALHFPIAAFCIVAGSACQALNKSMFSLITSCMRQIFALIPAAYLLSLTGDVNNIWWCFLIAEIVSFIFSFFFLRKAMRDADRRLRA